MKTKILFLFLLISIFGFSQVKYTIDYVIDDLAKNAEVFKSKDYGWTFVKCSSPKRYFFRDNDSENFTEFFDPNKYLDFSNFGFDGFNGNEYKGAKYGASFIPLQHGFITSYNKYNQNSGTLIIDFYTKTIIKNENPTIPLTDIYSFIQYDNSIYFTGRSKDLHTALYKIVNNGWEITAGNSFFEDYEVRAIAYDEQNDRLICTTGLTYNKAGLWVFKDSEFSEIDINKPDSYYYNSILGFVHFETEDKGYPIISGRYSNDAIGNELYLLYGDSVELINDASLEGVFGTNFYGTVFNDYSNLLFAATINDIVSPTKGITSEKGQGVYTLNFNNGDISRIENLNENILRIASTVRNKDGIYLVGTNTFDTYNIKSKYYVYLLKNDNPIVEKIDLKGEYLETGKTNLFVQDDIIYFTTNKGICKIQNENFENFFNTTSVFYSNRTSIVMVEENKIYVNYNDIQFMVISPDSSLGLNNNNFSESKLDFYPNPVTDIVTFSNNMYKLQGINIFDSTGKLVFKNKLNSNVTNIDMSSFANGLYTIVLMYNNSKKYLKIVKE